MATDDDRDRDIDQGTGATSGSGASAAPTPGWSEPEPIPEWNEPGAVPTGNAPDPVPGWSEPGTGYAADEPGTGYATDDVGAGYAVDEPGTGYAAGEYVGVPGTAQQPMESVEGEPEPDKPARRVAGTAREQAGQVTSQVKSKGGELLGRLRGEVGDQTDTQRRRLAGGLRSTSEELNTMASRDEVSGPAAQAASGLARAAGQTADWLEERDLDELVEEVRDFARRKPGTFVGLALVAGVVVGRLTRGLSESAQRDRESLR